jgi:hypothetical protein
MTNTVRSKIKEDIHPLHSVGKETCDATVNLCRKRAKRAPFIPIAQHVLIPALVFAQGTLQHEEPVP